MPKNALAGPYCPQMSSMTPGNAARAGHTSQPKVIRAAHFSAKIFLGTEVDAEAFVTKLRVELPSAVRAGQKERPQ